MASQDVISALETLHKELERLKPAINHIEIAQNITQLLNTIPQKHIEYVEEINVKNNQYKEELKTLFSHDISALSEENRNLQKLTLDIQDNVKEEQKFLKDIIVKVRNVLDEVESIDIYSRFDKIDKDISVALDFIHSIDLQVKALNEVNDKCAEIVSGMNGLQSKNEEIEEAISSGLKNIHDLQQKSSEALISSLEEFAKTFSTNIKRIENKQMIFSSITWLIFISGMLALYYFIRGSF